MSNIFTKLMPFLMACIALVAFAFGLILLTYLFVFGALIGVTLYAISWVRRRFFPSSHIVKSSDETPKKGRIIDHDDI